MCNPVQSIVDAIVEKIVGKAFQSVGHHVGFLFHYKQKLKNLEDEMNNLQGQRANVEGEVNQAKHRGEVVDDNVLVWLKDVDETRQGVDQFMGEKTVKESIQCFNFSCPDFIWRYRLSKQAEKKAVDIKHLAENGSKFGTVSHPKENPPELELPSIRDFENFHSRQKVFKVIVEALKDSKVNMIGVYGTGGVGKTTMVEKVSKLLKEDGTFDQVVMAVVSKDANVNNIQGQLADRLNLKLNGETEVGRANELWNRLDNEKNNLIILDDVWQELDLKKIGIPIKDGNKRCKVVLTSRNRDVCKNMDVHENFQVEFLIEEEAWTLFKKKVGNHVDSHDDPRHDIALAICKECQGLPVAINAIGASLKGKDMHAWKDALHKLKNSMLKDIEGIHQRVFASLKWSYDQLESENAKSCFLLCCLFAEDAEISVDDLVRYYMAWRTLHHYQMLATLEQAFDRVCTVVDTLKSCCLLLDGESKHFVKMHDVVRDIAISIAGDEKSFIVKHRFQDWPEKAAYEHCSVISLRPDDVRKFPDELVCPELHTLRLDCTINGSVLEVPNEFFIGTGNLMVLDLTRVIMSPLPASLAKLAKLQMLCLNHCNLGDISIIKVLKDHLEILSLQGSNIGILPPEVGELTRLRLLDMSYCWLEMIPKGVISKLFLLEELCMPKSFGKWEGTTDEREINNASLDELMSLTRLTALRIWIPNVALLPKDLSFENLVRFDIIISETSAYYGHWSNTKPLTGILKLGNFHGAKNLEFLLGKPKGSIPRNGLYPYLIDLSVSDCGMKYLFSPSCARELVGLQRLTIEHCGVMEGVIETEKDKDEDIPIIFSGLKRLYLGGLPNLISFYPEKGKTATSSGSSSGHAQTVLFNDKATFPALESLGIESVEKITELWDKQMLPIQETATESSFCQLSNMTIGRCDKLVNVVGGCPKLEAIATGHKQKGKEVDDYHVAHFPKLKNLQLAGLGNLESFCSGSIRCEVLPLFDHQASFPALESLEIYLVKKITEIWDKQMLPIQETATESSFCQLSNMTIRYCNKLVNVVGGCPKLEVIESEKQKGKEVDDYHVTRFPKLKNLRLEGLGKLESFCSRSIKCEVLTLFDHQVEFPVLEDLHILCLPKITGIWDMKLRPTESLCPLLTRLTVSYCHKLVNVVRSNMLLQLWNLKNLVVTECQIMEVIVDLEKKEEETQEAANNTIIPFPELTKMVLERLQNVKKICIIRSGEQPVFNAQVAFPKLENLYLTSLGEIALQQLLGACELLSLKHLKVSACEGIREVFHFDGQEVGDGQECVGSSLIQVRMVELDDLPQLTYLWNKDPRVLLDLQNLEYLTIKNCPLLANLFTASVAKALGGLKGLCLMSCSRMEEVIATDEEGHKDVIDDDHEIEFPKLERLIVEDLPNLKSFCSSNHNLNFPFLQRVVLKWCPKVQTFTSGSVRMPQIPLTTSGNDGLVMEDLNKHLEQQHLKGDEEIIWGISKMDVVHASWMAVMTTSTATLNSILMK